MVCGILGCATILPFNLTALGQVVPAEEKKALVEDILTEEEQRALSPQAVLEMLREGNQRFTVNDLTARNH